jgi:hypothetical protein
MEMPKATFDTWVREARFVAWKEGKFFIAVENEFARAWLTDRLITTFARILTGILNEPVEVIVTVTSLISEPLPPESAWEVVREELQHQFPHEHFAHDLQAAQFLAYYGQRLIIGMPTLEGQQWMATTVNGLTTQRLAELLETPVALQFVVNPGTNSPSVNLSPANLSKAEESGKTQVGRSAAEAEILIRPLRTSFYEILTRPKSVVIVPAYLLRWLPYLGPDKGWFLIAMRQRYFQAYGKKVTHQPHGQVFTANRDQIARWSGLGKNLVQQLLQELDQPPQKGNFLGWFMQSYEHGRGKAKTYAFRADMPLTPTDAEALESWLLNHNIREDPLETLQLALAQQPRDLLPFPPPAPEPSHVTLTPHPRTVQEVVLETARLAPASPTYLPLKRLAETLHQHLQSPADNLLLTHYFLLEWLPKLSRTPAWVITILRDRGFIDHHTGVRRDRIKLEGGYGELAQLLNVSERQIRDWLPPEEAMVRRKKEVPGITTYMEENATTAWEKHQNKRSLVGAFLDKTAQVDWRGNRETTYEFKVKLEEPLTPEHQEICDELEALLHESFVTADLTLLEALVTALDELVRESGSAASTWSAYRATTITPAPRFGQPPSEVLRDSDSPWSAYRATNPIVAPRIARLKALCIKYLYPKALLEIKQLLQQHLDELLPPVNALPACTASEGEGGIGDETWDWEKLLGYGGLTPASRAEILADPVLQTQYLGHVFYGYENRTTGDGKGIKAPFKYAEKHRHAQPLPEYLELARLSPAALGAVLEDWAREGPAFTLSDSAYRVAKALREHEFLPVLAASTTRKCVPRGPAS